MHCHEFESRLNDVLDQRGNPHADPRLADHAQQCEDCRARLAGSRVLLGGLSRLSLPALPRDFARRVVARAVGNPSAPQHLASRPPSRAWLAAGVLLASAAAALMAISIVWYARRAGENFVERASEVQPIPPGASSRPGRLRRGPATFAMTGGNLLIEAPRLPSLRNYRGAIDNLAVTLPQTVEQLDQVEQLAPGIRPIRRSFVMVWDTLRRTIPGSKTDEPSPPKSRTSHLPAACLQLA
jgi:hypothetical protein